MRRASKLPAALVLFAFVGQAETLEIGVFGLFHPDRLTVSAADGAPLRCRIDGGGLLIEGLRNIEATLVAGGLRLKTTGLEATSSTLECAGAGGFALAVPGRIERRFEGRLTLRPAGGEIRAVAVMDLETAVAAATAAETSAGWPSEALRTQATAARSYYAAGPRHGDVDFCDTTHCQRLGASVGPRHPAARAAADTRGATLVFAGRVVRALFSRSCGGRTLAASEAGLDSSAYPYPSVRCPICSADPVVWTRRHPVKAAAELLRRRGGEGARLRFVRRLGWDALPSNAYVARTRGDHVLFEGAGEGHGVGLCQRGVRGMAARGASADEILDHYFPGARRAFAAR